MPIHHVPRAHLHEDLLDITRKQGERITDVTLETDLERYVVVTEYVGDETRPANVEWGDRLRAGYTGRPYAGEETRDAS